MNSWNFLDPPRFCLRLPHLSSSSAICVSRLVCGRTQSVQSWQIYFYIQDTSPMKNYYTMSQKGPTLNSLINFDLCKLIFIILAKKNCCKKARGRIISPSYTVHVTTLPCKILIKTLMMFTAIASLKILILDCFMQVNEIAQQHSYSRSSKCRLIQRRLIQWP